MTPRVLSFLLGIGVLLAGGGAVIAASGGSSSHGSAAAAQYCPPSSPAGPGSRPPCGTPGSPGNPNSPGQNKKKNTKVRAKWRPRHRCAAHRFRAHYVIVNRPRGGTSSVFLDGRKVRTSKRSKFKVRLRVEKMRPGVHTLTLKTRDSDGRTVTKTIHFRRCG